MIEIPLVDELREVRRRLSEEQEGDPARYADMLQRVARDVPGSYVAQPLQPGGTDTPTGLTQPSEAGREAAYGPSC